MYSSTFLESPIYLKYANQPLSTFSASDIYTDLQNIQRCSVDELEAFDYLNRMLKALQMNSDGKLIVAGGGSALPDDDTTKTAVEGTTAVALPVASASNSKYLQFVSAFNNTAGALTVYLGNAGKTAIYYEVGITANRTLVTSTTQYPPPLLSGEIYAWWSGANTGGYVTTNVWVG